MDEFGRTYPNRPNVADLMIEYLERDYQRMAQRPKTGIYARTCLPSPSYDHCFELEAEDGKCYCRFKRDGTVTRVLMDYFEEVPPPDYET